MSRHHRKVGKSKLETTPAAVTCGVVEERTDLDLGSLFEADNVAPEDAVSSPVLVHLPGFVRTRESGLEYILDALGVSTFVRRTKALLRTR